VTPSRNRAKSAGSGTCVPPVDPPLVVEPPDVVDPPEVVDPPVVVLLPPEDVVVVVPPLVDDVVVPNDDPPEVVDVVVVEPPVVVPPDVVEDVVLDPPVVVDPPDVVDEVVVEPPLVDPPDVVLPDVVDPPDELEWPQPGRCECPLGVFGVHHPLVLWPHWVPHVACAGVATTASAAALAESTKALIFITSPLMREPIPRFAALMCCYEQKACQMLTI
jgi:hypothetical protein